MALTRGRLVALEGIDGCGKSTQAERLAAALRAYGIDTLRTREPSDGPSGERIREMARSGVALEPAEELRWFVEDRRVHVAERIEPALAAGRWVITDRYYLSTVAYQGARGLDWREILEKSEAEFPRPDLALLFELPPADALARANTRADAPQPVFERIDFLERVAAIFDTLDLPYLVRIDASGDSDRVCEAAWTAIAALFEGEAR